ncbi:MAG: uroporphyrinogen-III C-methyltransferase [Myxococcota bacterium]
MPAFPVDLRLAGKTCLVVGGGRVATRRVEALLTCEAKVTVVSPDAAPAIRAHAAVDRLVWWARRFAPGDCAGMALVLSAADDPAVAPAVHADAHVHGALVNVADVPALCDFFVGAVLRRGPVAVSVHTDGSAPGMAVHLRDRIAHLIDEHTARRVGAYGDLRRKLLQADRAPERASARADFLRQYQSDSMLDRLATRGRVDHALGRFRLALHRQGGGDGERPSAPWTRVAIVGAGPGDPELLTIRAAALIEQADDLVVDALVPPAVYARARGRVIYVGKRSGKPRIDQAEINAILVDLARAGRAVVRLKSGDPGLFGRLSEEMIALAAAGIDIELVPGVSSALAAPLCAGVPLTARGVTDRVTILTGQARAGTETTPSLPAYDAEQTVVVMMGLAILPGLVERAVAAGYPPDLPATVIGHATQPTEQILAAPLGDLPRVVRQARLESPATVVIGPTAGASLIAAGPALIESTG